MRRVKPSRRQMRNLTDYEKKTGWRYSIICTNMPGAGIGGVPGSHHPQYIDVVHREHACVETAGVRTAKAMGLRVLPSKTWQVNCGWVIAANIAADLAAWTRLLGCHDDGELRDADPDTLRYRIWHIPARLAHHARQRTLKISPGWPWKQASSHAGSGSEHAGTRLTSSNHPANAEGGPPRRSRNRYAPGYTGHPAHPAPPGETDIRLKNGCQHDQ